MPRDRSGWESFQKTLEIVEIAVFAGGLLAFSAYEFASSLLLSEEAILRFDRKALGVLAAAFLAGIHLVLTRLKELKSRGGFAEFSTFSEAASTLFRETGIINVFCILAYTSLGWREELDKLVGSGVKIKHLRILLLHDDKFATRTAESHRYGLSSIVAAWKAMLRDSTRPDSLAKRVDNIEIRVLPMVTTYYFGIADSRLGVFGYLRPRGSEGGLHTGEAALVTAEREPDAYRLVHSSQALFDSFWEWRIDGAPYWKVVLKHPPDGFTTL